MTKKKAASDFRYDTGAARVPWAAVGENVQMDEMKDIPVPGPAGGRKRDAIPSLL